MPTGYTADVCDGKQTEFKDFALTCARAFGALIMMRDDPAGAPIPEGFEPSSWNAQRLAEARDKLAALRTMTPEQAEAAAAESYTEALASHLDYEAKEQATEDRLDAMIAKTEAWVPPTADHVEMKKFMLDQLRISKRGDYRSARPEKLSGADWLAAEQKSAERDVGYHAAENAKEIERAKSRTEWVKSLRASL